MTTGRRSTLAGVFRNPELRRVELAFVCFNAAEWGAWIAMLVYAYTRGGATTAGLVAVAQLAPAALFAPLASSFADRYAPARVLTFGLLAQAASVGATAIVLLADGPPLLAYGLAAAATCAFTITRPAQAALTPALARSPQELTAVNVVSGWVESVSILGAPAAAGGLLAVGSPGLVFAVTAAVALLGALLVRGLGGPGPMSVAATRSSINHVLIRLARLPETRLLIVLLGATSVLAGALDVMLVLLAVDVLDLGGSGAGYLNAAFGAGGVAGIAFTTMLIGRARLVPPLLAGAALWSCAFLLLGLPAGAAVTVGLLAIAGCGRSLLDVAGRTILQRVAPSDVLARAFGGLEGISMASLATGALLAPALVGLVGARGTMAVLAALLPILVLAGGRVALDLDRNATMPVVEIALLRSLPLFSSLGAPELESLARSLQPTRASAGEVVVRQGDPGDRFYLVADGELDVTADGRYLRVLRHGDGFGELALLVRGPRTATVRARTHASLYTLTAEAFLGAVARYPGVASEGSRLVADRLGSASRPGARMRP